MNKRVIIVHGWEKGPESDWFPWAKKELEKLGYEVSVPEMPDTDAPKIEAWVSKLQEVAGEVDENTILIGHSIGCQTILRFLERLPEGQMVNKVICAGGWFSLTEEAVPTDEEKEIAKPWLETPINFKKVKKMANSFVAIFSDNDPYVPLENSEIFKEKLGSEVVIEHHQGHFNEEVGITELPILLKFIE